MSEVSPPTSAPESGGLYWFEPLSDPRWTAFLQRHPASSIFHTPEWLEALRRTYGYQPVAITTCPPGADLTNAALFCRVDSWLTGRRLVSLPFSDHCGLLVDDGKDLSAMISALRQELHSQDLRYIEVRSMPVTDTADLGSHSTCTYCLHQIDLLPKLDTLFANFHKDSTQRKVRRAEREGVRCEEGNSAFLLDSFYRLLLLTRRRHGIPPQPMRWFLSLIDCFGHALKIKVAFKDKQPIAAILTLRHKGVLVYKYGCSDERFHPLGGMHLLFWRTIQEAKRDGVQVFDLGRSDWKDAGLIQFKDRWGAQRTQVTYLRLLASLQSTSAYMPADADWKGRLARRMFARLPDRLLCDAGDLIYRHIG
jgi:CelD/BcsL family acetyltransferase involved in cellulose biosynthesis